MTDTIYIDTVRVADLSRELMELNNKMNEPINIVREQVNKLSSGWSGEAAESVIRCFGELEERFVTQRREAMNDLAVFLQNVAQGYEKTENDNSNIVEDASLMPGGAPEGNTGNTGAVVDKKTKIQVQLDEFQNWCLNSANWGSTTDGGNQGLDVDGYAGAQCADISKAWYKKLFGVDIGLSAWANGKPQVSFNPGDTMDKVAAGGPYMTGDIGFSIVPPNNGHTYVVVSDQDENGKVLILEQNPSSPKIREVHSSYITDAFRAKEV